MLARAPARIDRPIGSRYGNRMGWRWLENQSAPMKMAAARNTSAGAVFPVPAGTSQGIAAMATPITTFTTLRRRLADGVAGGIPGRSGMVRPGSTGVRGLAREVTGPPR